MADWTHEPEEIKEAARRALGFTYYRKDDGLIEALYNMPIAVRLVKAGMELAKAKPTDGAPDAR